jgi:murein DD-endopeptidase MepM/ murein hydrolase activator NlpD
VLPQGKTIEITLGSDIELTPVGSLNGFPLHFFPEKNGLVALQGIERMSTPGLTSLELLLAYPDGSQASFTQPLRILNMNNEYGFDVAFQVADEYIDPEVTIPEAELIAGIVSTSPPERLWNGLFVPPTPRKDCINSTFGRLRSYNGSPYNYFHSGLDYCGMTGVEIYSAADGIVVYTGELTVRGLATVISHGQGVFSGYWHQSEILVEVGDEVVAGQLIGKYGETGRVTGPHLHFEIWVNGVQVDPMDWLKRIYP